MTGVNLTYLWDQVSSNTSRSGYVKYRAFFMFKETKRKPKFMPIDYSRQIGKKIITKGDKMKFINIENIVYIHREGYLTTIYLNTGVKVYEIKSLCAFEKELFEMGFFRIRDNTIINGNYITEVDTKIHKRTVKLGAIEFTVSKRRLKSFNDWIL